MQRKAKVWGSTCQWPQIARPDSSHRTPISLVFLVNKHCPTVCSCASYILNSCLHPVRTSSSLPPHTFQANTMRSHQVALSIANSLESASQGGHSLQAGVTLTAEPAAANPRREGCAIQPLYTLRILKASPLVRHQVTFNSFTAFIPRPKSTRFSNRFKNCYS